MQRSGVSLASRKRCLSPWSNWAKRVAHSSSLRKDSRASAYNCMKVMHHSSTTGRQSLHLLSISWVIFFLKVSNIGSNIWSSSSELKIEKLCSDLVKLKTFEKERYLRYEYPTVYQDLLWFSGREKELAKIWPAHEDVTPYNYSWYIQGEILARLNYWRARGGLS